MIYEREFNIDINVTNGVTDSCMWACTFVSLTVGGSTSPLIKLPTNSEFCLSAIPSASGLVLTAGGSSSHLYYKNISFKLQ